MIQVKQLHLQSANERVATRVLDNDRTGQFIINYRRVGPVNGKAYYWRKANYKNPE